MLIKGLMCYLIALISIASTSSYAQDKLLSWVAFGDLRGNFEPCGCDRRTNFGGIIRLGRAVSKIRTYYPKVMVFNLGNNYSFKEADLVADKYIQQGIVKIQPTATLLNLSEINYHSKTPQTLNLVVSNLNNNAAKKWPTLSKYIHTNNAIILGYVWSKEQPKSTQSISFSLIKTWQVTLNKFKNKKRILLFSGPQKDLQYIVQSNLFNTIISANTALLQTSGFNDQEKTNPWLLRRYKNPIVMMVPVEGRGLLLSSAIKKLSLSKKLVNTTNKKPSFLSSNTNEALQSRLQWLDRSYTQGSPLLDLNDDYNKARADELKKLSQQYKKKNLYAGATSCQGCHQQAFLTWQKSPHAHAFNTLKNTNKSNDPSCLKCHVVAFAKPGGYINHTTTSKLANVQCENCHGPRLEHTKNPIQKTATKTLTNCTTCHNNSHSPSFAYESYWRKIKH